MFYDYSKRDYLLPNGCKDLIDVLKLKQLEASSDTVPTFEDFLSLCQPKHFVKHPAQSLKPPVAGEIVVSEPITVRDLAKLLNQEPFQIVADLMSLKILATVDHALDFATVCKVAAIHGYAVKKTT